ncbi:Ribosome assembly protein rrb1 [Coemansia erecta]|nr:Ribosome assembly protein rrb1 [Coemansia erecta]
MESFEKPGTQVPASAQQSLFTVVSHGQTEEYAMNWNVDGRLLTGDCGHSNQIYLTTCRNDTGTSFVADRKAFRGYTALVEDIQWSPEVLSVLASFSVDQTIKIWDVWVKNHTYVLDVLDAQDSDINVISWNC